MPDILLLLPEIEITIKVYMCSRCGHLWERRVKGTKDLPVTCPSCNSPFWNRFTKGKTERDLLPLMFHGEEVLRSNFEEVYRQGKGQKKK
jgi:DNA-directed RNA polymerase subunit RPC12/RpoP